jgi:predicted ATPase/DNA-binding winged helix-turn-helix (wHTH) protein
MHMPQIKEASCSYVGSTSRLDDGAATWDAISFGPFLLRSRVLERDGRPVKVGSRAIDILWLLVGRAGEVVPKLEILAYAWSGLAVEEISLRVHVAELRKALGDGKDGVQYIMNIPSRGYCFVAPVRRGGPSPAPSSAPSFPTMSTPPTTLPHRLDRLIGRDEVVQDLSERLLNERFITLWGAGGIGKTTVAIALAYQMREAFEGNVHFVDLSLLRNAALVADTVASSLGLIPLDIDASENIINNLRDRRLFLVLDSCEHVIDEVAKLAESIYRQAPDVVILATSREQLLVQGEHIVEVAPLPSPPRQSGLSASAMLSYPAARLLADRAAAAGHDDDISDEDAEVLTEICDKLDGIALAIEFAAVRIGIHGLQQAAEMLEGRLSWRGRRTAPLRQQTLEATLDWSFELISENERIVLRRLAVFAGPFTIEGAIAIAAEPGQPIDVFMEALEQLVAKSLVSAPRGGSSRSYRLLDATRTYALQKLRYCGESDRMILRHDRYLQSTLEATIIDRDGDPPLHVHHRSKFRVDHRAAPKWGQMGGDDVELILPFVSTWCGSSPNWDCSTRPLRSPLPE